MQTIYDGLYPNNSLLQSGIFIILLFEMAVMAVESVIIVLYLERRVKMPTEARLNIIMIVVIANAVTFMLGAIGSVLVG